MGPLVLCELCLLIMAVSAATLLIMLKGSRQGHRARLRTADVDETILLASDLVPGVTMIAVPPDASAASMQFVRQLAKLHFGRLEIVLVLDGESDENLSAWKREFHLSRTDRPLANQLNTEAVKAVYTTSEPIPLIVVEKEAGGHADCLNAGVNLATAPVIGTVDWNARFSDQALLHLIGPMIDDPLETLAVGAVAPPPAAGNLAGRIHHLEFARTWLCRCAGLSAWNAFLPAPGAFLLFRRSAVIQAGGFRGRRAGCGLDMTIRLHALAMAAGRPYSIRLIASPVSSPAVPGSFREARLESVREQMEVAGALRRHMRTAFSSGKVGGLAIPGLWCTRFLMPLLETSCLILAIVALFLGWMDPVAVGLLAAATVAFGILVSMSAVLLEPLAVGTEMAPGELAALFFTPIRENLGYRQRRNLRLIRDFVRGFWAA